MTSRTTQRLVLIGVLLLLVVGGAFAAFMVMDDDDEPTTTTDGRAEVVSLAEGAAARAQQAAALADAKAAVSDTGESAPGLPQPEPAASSLPVDCGFEGEGYVPTPDEIASVNADTDGLAAAFDRYGIAYTRQSDEFGYTWLDYEFEDVFAESVASSYWEIQYPIEPLSEEDLAANRAEVDALTAAFDAAGVVYTRETDESGWEWIEWDYDDATAQRAADEVYSELYPPEPLPPEELERIRVENDGLAAALDAVGVAYTRLSDESGWEWIEWDYDDPAAQQAVDEYFLALYPVEPCLTDPGIPVDAPLPEEPGDGDAAVSGPGPVDEPVIEEIPAAELEIVRAENDGLAAAFDAAGVVYTRETDESGWEWIEWDYDDPSAQLVADAYYEELYAPDPAVVAAHVAAVDALTAAFDGAGVAHLVRGESPYDVVVFDLDAPGAPEAFSAARAQ